MQGILQHQGTEALVQPGKSFLRDDGRIAVESSVVARDDWHDLQTRVCVVNDCPCTLDTERARFS